jgi:hypothetical protein
MLDLPPASIAIMSCGAVKKVEMIVSLSENECFVKGVGKSKCLTSVSFQLCVSSMYSILSRKRKLLSRQSLPAVGPPVGGFVASDLLGIKVGPALGPVVGKRTFGSSLPRRPLFVR